LIYTSLTSWALTKDKTGRITQKQETVAGATSNYAYTYDPMGRLLTVTKDGSLVESYQYGPNGARISEMNALRGISSRTMAYTEEDHIYQAGDTTYQYDVDGFLLSKTKGAQVTQYSYSSRGELLQVNLPDGRVIDYYHDSLGRRIAKAVNGTITEKYLWQGLTRLLAVYDGANNLIMRFNYADARMPVSMTTGGNTYYLTYDQVGSLRIVADSSGNAVKRIDYDSFGNILNDINPGFPMSFAFAGGIYDRDTGLVRFGFRDYDPDTGRWTEKDPIGFAGGDTDLYGYSANNPINFIDPSGLSALKKFFEGVKEGHQKIHKDIRDAAAKMSPEMRTLVGATVVLAGTVLVESGTAVVIIGAPTGLGNIVTIPVGVTMVFLGGETMYIGYEIWSAKPGDEGACSHD
jgi:RHS repeat-associated protein